MRNSKKFPSIFLRLFCFLFLEFFLYLYFLVIDFRFPKYEDLSSIVKLSGISLCLLFALCEKSYRSALILFLTLCADVFLLFTDRYIPGILLFYLIQCSYHRVLFPGRKLSSFCFTPVTAAAFFVLLLIYQGFSIDPPLVLAAVYFISLLYNSILTLFHLRGKKKGEIIFALGLMLLLFCDIQVGLYNAGTYLPAKILSMPIFSILNHAAANGMWLCYLPSQIFITLALLELTNRKPHI